MHALLCVAAVFVGASLAAQLPRASPIETGTLVVRGRCVDFDTGAPLLRCRVLLTGHQSTGYALSWGRGDWADPPEVTTGADGTFRFELRLSASDEGLDRGRYHLRISHAHHAAWFSHCAFVVATALGGVDYGDVRLPKGVRPRIRCEDPNGALQPGVILYLRGNAAAGANDAWSHVAGDGPHWWIERSAYERTDIDGYLHLADPLPTGEYTLSVRGREACRAPGAITLPNTDAIVAVVAPIDSAMAITGRLVDESGQPVEGALLSDGDDGPTSCVTRRDGAFTLVRGKETGRPTALLRMAQNSRYDGWVTVGEVDWGKRDVTLEVPAKTLHTFVVHTADGAPVEDFNLYCLRRDDERPTAVRLAGSFAGGRAVCRLPDGTYEMLVIPRSDRVLTSSWQTVAIKANQQEIAVAVPRAVARAVEVAFADDRKVAAGVLVEAIVGDEPGPFEWVRPATVVDPSPRPVAKRHLVASARTDERGRATLQLREAGSLYLRVSGPGVRTFVGKVDLTNGDRAAPILVERGATLLGSLGPLATLRALDPDRPPGEHPSIYSYYSWSAPTLTIVFNEGRQRREGVRLDSAGCFRCDGLPPGPVEVQLRRWERVGAARRILEPPTSLGSFTLRVDMPQQVTLRVPGAAGDGR